MTFNDVEIIVKKILIGITLVIIPILILWGGLRLTTKLLSPSDASPSSEVTINPK